MLTADDVSALMPGPASVDQIEAALAVITALARSFTRGGGWTDDEPADDINAVILSATCRLLTNVGQLPISESMGAFSVNINGGFTGWSLVELAVLNRYRERAK